MKTIHLFIVFLIVAVVQLYVPAKIILNKENVLETGNLYKFRTQPIDPSDPFRGKYITLNYEARLFKTRDSIWERNERIYVYVTTDSLGYAKVDDVSKNLLPWNDNDYIEAKAGWYTYSDELEIKFPFNRFYMEETKAYDAEVAVRIRARDSLPNNTHAVVYVKDGQSVLSDVVIDDISIKDYVEKED